MLRNMLTSIRTALFLLILMSLLTGLLYPALITGIGQLFFKSQSNGSVLTKGSTLIGQSFTEPRYFWGRPSATTPYPNNAASSGGSNLAPSNPLLIQAIQSRVENLKKADPTNKAVIPIDLVTASASGLDPDISVAAANYQVNRVAKARHLPVKTVQHLVKENTEHRQFDVLGEPRVNVLKLNLALDALNSRAHAE